MASEVSAVLADQLRRKGGMSPWWEAVHTLFTRKYLATFGLAVLVLLILTAAFADVVAPYSPVALDFPSALQAPSAQHLLGTDQVGRDLLSRMIYGARTSIFVGVGVMLIAVTLGSIVGGVSAYKGGKFDVVVQRLVDAVQSVPALLLLLTIISIIGPGMVNVILALGFRAAVGDSRVVRGSVLGIMENQYIEGARAIGAGNLRILVRYVLPNIMAPIIVVGSLQLGAAILAESTLSFLGWGVPPPTPTWGGMLSNEARRFMIDAPWLAIFPGLALSLAVYGINMFGDGLRDVFDPRLRGSR